MNEELEKLKKEWIEEIDKLGEPDDREYFKNSNDCPYLTLAKKYEKKIKEIKEKYKDENTQEK